MSVEEGRQLEARSEATRGRAVDLLIRLTVEGEINWDFSDFENSTLGQAARAEHKGVKFISTHIQDEGIELAILHPDYSEQLRSPAAERLRKFLLEEIGPKDPVLIEIKKEREARSKRIYGEREEKFEKRMKGLDQITQLLQDHE